MPGAPTATSWAQRSGANPSVSWSRSVAGNPARSASVAKRSMISRCSSVRWRSTAPSALRGRDACGGSLTYGRPRPGTDPTAAAEGSRSARAHVSRTARRRTMGGGDARHGRARSRERRAHHLRGAARRRAPVGGRLRRRRRRCRRPCRHAGAERPGLAPHAARSRVAACGRGAAERRVHRPDPRLFARPRRRHRAGRRSGVPRTRRGGDRRGAVGPHRGRPRRPRCCDASRLARVQVVDRDELVAAPRSIRRRPDPSTTTSTR